MEKLTTVRAAALLVLAGSMTLVAGCALHNGQGSSRNTPAPHSFAPQRHASPALNVTRTPPDISGSTKTFVRLANKTGSQEMTVIPSIKTGTLAVATECIGEGKTTIGIGGLATYTIPCATTSTATYNEIGLGSSSHDVLVTVTAGAGIHWGLSVGWRPGVEHPS